MTEIDRASKSNHLVYSFAQNRGGRQYDINDSMSLMSSWVCGLPLAHHFSFKQIVMKNTDHLGMNESNLNLYNRASNYYKYLKSQSQKEEKVKANQIQMTLIRKADLK